MGELCRFFGIGKVVKGEGIGVCGVADVSVRRFRLFDVVGIPYGQADGIGCCSVGSGGGGL